MRNRKVVGIHLVRIVLFISCILTSRQVRAMDFGFTYWPAGYNSNVLYDINWTPENVEIVTDDLDIMASYSSKILRLMVWPQVSGYMLHSGSNGGNWGDGGFFTADFNNVTDNFLDIVQMCSERGIDIFLSFGNNYHTSLYQESPPIYWWQLGYNYPNDPNAHANFCADSVTWMNGFVDKIEASPWASTVIYYDYHPEWSSLRSKAVEYIQYLYDNSNIPAGKRYVSPLIIADWHNDAADLKAALGSRVIDCADVHSYPYIGHCVNIEYCYDLVAASFPSVPIYIGEFGSNGDANEPAMQTLVLDITNRAAAKGYAGITHWMLWDNAPPLPNAVYAWGYDAHSPKDVMGGMAELLTLAPNPDMETLNGTEPANWVAGGTVPFTFYYNNVAATNLLCARILVNNTSGKVWMSSSLIPVNGGRKLFVSCYVRASMDNVTVNVVEYDGSQALLAKTSGPQFTPPAWQWYNYIRATQSWFVSLSQQTRYVIVSIGGEVRNNPSILDVDTVSVWESNAQALRSDFNSDSVVDNFDLAGFMEVWCSTNTDINWNNIYNLALPQDGTIDFEDFAYLAAEWMSRVN